MLSISLAHNFNFIKLNLFLIIINSQNYVKGANILALMGCASPSHHIWNSALTHELAKQGHNVTILSVDLPRKGEEIPANAHYIYLEKTYDSMYSEGDNEVKIDEIMGVGSYYMIFELYDYIYKSLVGIVRSDGLNVLLNYPNEFKFDLILYDSTIGPGLLAFAHKFNYPPIVGISAFLNPPISRDMIGGHYFPGYVPFIFLEADVEMSFPTRMFNHFLVIFDTIYRKYVYNPRVDKLMRTKFPADMPYIGNWDEKQVIALVNSHPAINYAESLPPGIIEVAGMQIKDPKPLPDELENFVKNSKKGFIFISLGTNVHPDDLGPERTEMFVETIRQLPQYNFLWKFDQNAIKSKLPINLLTKPFFPQSDVLAHPQIKAFLTHGGGLSTQESVWRGVPMIGLPLFADQQRNIHQSVRSGIATKMDLKSLSVQYLKSAILKVTENSQYYENMKLKSARLRDRPMKALDTAVWWVEYVLRNPNPEHLKSPTLKVGFIIANSIDFIVIFILLVMILLYLFIKIGFYFAHVLEPKNNINKLKKK